MGNILLKELIPSKQKISREKLEAGDHIYAYRMGRLYFHNGIYVGDGWVIHLTATQAPISRTSTTESICRICGHDPNTKRGVLKTCIDCFLQGHSLYRFDYNVSFAEYFFTRNWKTSSREKSYSREETVRRAIQIFEIDEVHGTGFGEYDLIHNNCEHFATYCKTGKRVSKQIQMNDGLTLRMIAGSSSLRSSS